MERKNNNKNRIPLSITYNRTLPNISITVNRNWNILQINTEFHRVFKDTDSIQMEQKPNTVKQGKVVERNMTRIS